MIKTHRIDTKEQLINAMLDIAGKDHQINRFEKDGEDVTIEDIFDVTIEDPYWHIEQRIDDILFYYINDHDRNYFRTEVLRYIAKEYERRHVPCVRDIIEAYAELYYDNIIHHYVTEFLELGVKERSHYEGLEYTLHHINEMYVYSTEEYRDMIKNNEDLEEDETEEELEIYDKMLKTKIVGTVGWSKRFPFARFVRFDYTVYVVEEVL